MEKAKAFITRYFEQILILCILAGLVVVIYAATYKLGFLNFFYLPAVLSGYYLGKRMAVLTALFCVTAVVLYAILDPATFFGDRIAKTDAALSIVSWGSFLLLTSAALGYLYEEKERRISELRDAYIGILEIMAKYLESADRYTQGHSVRVAHLAQDIAVAMGLPKKEVENIKAASLLHDIGKTEISMDIVNKAASLTRKERQLLNGHSEAGAKILAMAGAILQEAVPIVMAHHKYYFVSNKFASDSAERIPIGAAIIAVADAYDAIVTDRPYRAGKQPWQAFEEIEAGSGTQFHPEVVAAFKRVLQEDESYRLERPGFA